MKRWISLLALPATLLLGMASEVHAAVTFDEMAPTSGVVVGDLWVEDYRFSSSHGHAITNLGGYGASNGSNYLVMLVNGSSTERITSAGGSSFELLSVDLGGWLNFGTSQRQLELTGYRAGGALVQSLLEVQPGGFRTYALSGFTDLVSLQLRASGGTGSYYVAIDNLLLSPVPEPDVLVLLLSGLILLGVRSRRSA